MDIKVTHTEEGIVFEAISERAIAYYEEKVGEWARQITAVDNPSEILRMFPKGFIIFHEGSAPQTLN